MALLFGSDEQHGKLSTVKPIGTTDIRLLQSGDRDDFIRLHVPVNFPRLSRKPSLAGVGTILNLITDADINATVLGHAERFLRSFEGRVINPPAAVLGCTRNGVAALLAGIDGLLHPPLARFRGRPNLAMAAIEKAGLRFPAILRRAGRHDGQIEGLFWDCDKMLSRLDPAVTYYLTQFVNSSSAGLFHKIRVFYFGDRGVVRHRLISDDWNVHAPARARVLAHHPEHIEIERRYIEGGIEALPAQLQPVLKQIRQRLPLDYFGLDFAIMADGRLLLFEANATMMFFPVLTDPPFAYAAAVIPKASAAFNAMLAINGEEADAG